MRRPVLPSRRLSLSALATALAAVLVLGGALIWFVPYLTRKQEAVAEVPNPPALLAVTEFPLPPHQQACMSAITVDPKSHVAQFQLRPLKPTRALGPPVDLVLSAPGYTGVVHVPGGYPGGAVALPLNAPPRTVIATGCFVNRGKSTVLLDGTTETRTVSRSSTLINGTAVAGDIALTFLDDRPRSLSGRLGEVFGHASNLTDRLIPVWLIWLLALLVALGVPVGVLGAFFRSLSEDEASGAL
jgi:hypothetical protein